MTRVIIPNNITFARGDVEQIVYILALLEHFFTDNKAHTGEPVTQFVVGGETAESMARWVAELAPISTDDYSRAHDHSTREKKYTRIIRP